MIRNNVFASQVYVRPTLHHLLVPTSDPAMYVLPVDILMEHAAEGLHRAIWMAGYHSSSPVRLRVVVGRPGWFTVV